MCDVEAPSSSQCWRAPFFSMETPFCWAYFHILLLQITAKNFILHQIEKVILVNKSKNTPSRHWMHIWQMLTKSGIQLENHISLQTTILMGFYRWTPGISTPIIDSTKAQNHSETCQHLWTIHWIRSYPPHPYEYVTLPGRSTGRIDTVRCIPVYTPQRTC